MIRYKRTRGREKKGDRNWRVPAGLFLLLSFVFIFTIADVKIKAAGKSPDFLGKPLEDFSVKTIDKSTFTLSETLKEKDLVMINLWASWCGPCEMEFPAIEKAYEEYKDRVAVLALPEGSHKISISFVKDMAYNGPEDCGWISNVRLLSGQEAGKSLDSLPVYPVGDSLKAEILADSAKYIELEHGGQKDQSLGDTPVCLLPGGTKKVPVRVTLPPSMDPEMTVLSIGDSMNFHPVSSYLTEDASGYEFELDLSGDDSEHMNYFLLYYALDEGLGENEERSFATIVLAGKKGLNSYIEMYRNEGYSITGWHYVK